MGCTKQGSELNVACKSCLFIHLHYDSKTKKKTAMLHPQPRIQLVPQDRTYLYVQGQPVLLKNLGFLEFFLSPLPHVCVYVFYLFVCKASETKGSY